MHRRGAASAGVFGAHMLLGEAVMGVVLDRPLLGEVVCPHFLGPHVGFVCLQRLWFILGEMTWKPLSGCVGLLLGEVSLHSSFFPRQSL